MAAGKSKNFLRYLGGKDKFKDILPKTLMCLQKPEYVPRLPVLNSEGKFSIFQWASEGSSLANSYVSRVVHFSASELVFAVPSM
jgi:hypothetical protein